MTSIIEILNHCARSSTEFTLKVHVIFGSPTMKLKGYHVPGEPWEVFDYDDMIEFTERDMTNALHRTGCDMAGRPVKQPGLDMHWPMMAFGQGSKSALVNAPSADAIERKRQNDAFREIEVTMDL